MYARRRKDEMVGCGMWDAMYVEEKARKGEMKFSPVALKQRGAKGRDEILACCTQTKGLFLVILAYLPPVPLCAQVLGMQPPLISTLSTSSSYAVAISPFSTAAITSCIKSHQHQADEP
jgi:hypothetical protein